MIRVIFGRLQRTRSRILASNRTQAYDTDELVEIKANIDDLSPQIYDHLVERLFDSGARDVTATP